jgi:hypothetical protein
MCVLILLYVCAYTAVVCVLIAYQDVSVAEDLHQHIQRLCVCVCVCVCACVCVLNTHKRLSLRARARARARASERETWV